MTEKSKRRRRIALITAIASVLLIATVVIGVRSYNSQALVFYLPLFHEYTIEVQEAHKNLAREIYTDSKRALSQILVSESKSRIIHWVFISETELRYDEEKQILDMMFAYLQNPEHSYPIIWEVFFCENENVKSAYVSHYGIDTRIGDPDDRFNEWYPVPDAENLISYSALKKMMHIPARTMYHMGVFEGQTPYIPET